MPKPKEPAVMSAAKLEKKILVFFSENPGSIDTPRGVATWITADLRQTRRALERLVDRGSLKAHRTSSTVAYSRPAGAARGARAAKGGSRASKRG